MAGRATLNTSDSDAATDPRIFMWHPISGIITAQDPLVHQEQRNIGTAGLALTFAKEYLKTIPSNRKVLLVGAAYGGTSFYEDVTAPKARWNFTQQAFENVSNLHHRWMVTQNTAVGGDLYRGAVRRANDAMAAAGSGARFVGILWHQGESDAVVGGADDYATNHRALMAAFRSEITGATSTTPIVVGEFNPCFMAACPDRTGAQPTAETFQKILNYFHTLPETMHNTAWVSSAGLGWMSDGTHFDLPSIRQLGRRYADKFFEAKNDLPQPITDLKIYNQKYFNVGRSLHNDPLSARIDGNVTIQGTVSNIPSAEHGYVVKIDNTLGSLAINTDGSLFNSSYTKMVWVKLNTLSYTNNLIAGLSSAQRHHLNIPNGRPAAGHGSSTTTYVQSPSSISVNTWAHIAVVYHQGSQVMKLYVNGVLADTALSVPSAPLQSGAMDLQLSRYGTGSSTYGIDGLMIDNKVYQTALNATQIAAIYNFELTNKAGY